MFGFWMVLSGKFDVFHLTLGVLASVLVTYLSHDLLIQHREKKGRQAEIGRFVLYIPWILAEIFKATLHVVRVALHPRMRDVINPTIVCFRTSLKKEISQVALANSITLTPGTITIRNENGQFTVHALTEKTAAGLPGPMERRLAKVFKEE
jgi:multicomponent Na+:H+ antiporter subunit E